MLRVRLDVYRTEELCQGETLLPRLFLLPQIGVVP